MPTQWVTSASGPSKAHPLRETHQGQLPEPGSLGHQHPESVTVRGKAPFIVNEGLLPSSHLTQSNMTPLPQCYLPSLVNCRTKQKCKSAPQQCQKCPAGSRAWTRTSQCTLNETSWLSTYLTPLCLVHVRDSCSPPWGLKSLLKERLCQIGSNVMLSTCNELLISTMKKGYPVLIKRKRISSISPTVQYLKCVVLKEGPNN